MQFQDVEFRTQLGDGLRRERLHLEALALSPGSESALLALVPLSTKAALHINAIMSLIPTRMYKPATVTVRYTSAMTLSGGSLICLWVTELLRAIVQPK